MKYARKYQLSSTTIVGEHEGTTPYAVQEEIMGDNLYDELNFDFKVNYGVEVKGSINLAFLYQTLNRDERDIIRFIKRFTQSKIIQFDLDTGLQYDHIRENTHRYYWVKLTTCSVHDGILEFEGIDFLRYLYSNIPAGKQYYTAWTIEDVLQEISVSSPMIRGLKRDKSTVYPFLDADTHKSSKRVPEHRISDVPNTDVFHAILNLTSDETAHDFMVMGEYSDVRESPMLTGDGVDIPTIYFHRYGEEWNDEKRNHFISDLNIQSSQFELDYNLYTVTTEIIPTGQDNNQENYDGNTLSLFDYAHSGELNDIVYDTVSAEHNTNKESWKVYQRDGSFHNLYRKGSAFGEFQTCQYLPLDSIEQKKDLFDNAMAKLDQFETTEIGIDIKAPIPFDIAFHCGDTINWNSEIAFTVTAMSIDVLDPSRSTVELSKGVIL